MNDAPAREDDQPLLTFLTPTLDPALTSLERTLNAIEGVRRAGLRTEHLVVDAGSTDQIRQFISERPHTTLIDAPRANISESLSIGWRAATGLFVMVMNAGDMPTAALEGALTRLDHDGAEVIVLPVIDEHDVVTRPRRRGSVLESTWIHAGMIARTDLVGRCGGYDRRYQFAMDWEWLSRAERQGVTIKYFPREEPVVRMEAFGLSRQRTMSSGGEFLDVARRDVQSRTRRLLILGRRLPAWLLAYIR